MKARMRAFVCAAAALTASSKAIQLAGRCVHAPVELLVGWMRRGGASRARCPAGRILSAVYIRP
jgi:hypothetical protein